MVYLRPSEAEINTWPTLGNENWTWNSLFPYYKKSEHLQIPTQEQEQYQPSWEPYAHGFAGPLKTGWWKGLNTTGFGPLLNSSWSSNNLTWNLEPNAGNLEGLFLHPSEYDTTASIREDTARAYYWPISNRWNLHTYTFTNGLKVLFADEATYGSASLVATGVEVLLANGLKSNISAKREIILSTGTYRTPGILEASGIGNPSILSNLSVPVKVDLPGVGAHMQDQFTEVLYFNTTIATPLDTEIPQMPYKAVLTMRDLFSSERLSEIASYTRSQIPAYASLIVANGGGTSVAVEEALLKIRTDLIFNQNAPVGELILYPLIAAFYNTLPLSSGSIHAANVSSQDIPVINNNVMAIPFDVNVTAALGRLARKIYATPPLDSITLGELLPGYAAVPLNASDAQWKAYFDASWGPTWHAVGTTAMMKRELGGVLDDTMTVYGTSNLRVVSAAAIPFELNGHPTSTLYAMAEKVSDLIKEKWA